MTARRALVTGCSSGIGETITRRLLDDGWSVVGLARRRPAIEHERLGFVSVDLLDTAALSEAMSGIEPVDAIVHAAGVLRVGTLGEMDCDDGRLMWSLHVDAAARLVQHFAPTLPDGGRIILVGSRVAAGLAGRSLYAASKAALVGMARSWAAELAPRQITVNVIAPGATDTPMLRDPKRSGSAPRMPPMGRLVKPEEVAALAAFLLSDMAGSITGQQIVVCAGASL
ncbi:SDR family NAD(P)-dependent oxidoreductase [Consotaella salsifontis]|uniref:NAD(P)-dependent dehydrogenase, short-chain alcohol dehydrogenase family n=1 Tax=Consotaella salsifontis TaxID=1365950 RepID=A0A1T4T1J0_9HYPH|nr:SDR family oxidoreductase [Consotaella salsifontis]SKA34323.1 NAD(P)-dependent dehydrogenase, short-chain alcohol dehydrogenase family [Consotaella salsifontis]